MLDTLRKTKPREKAGARTAARFEFQVNFSILKILDVHEAGGDYRAIFDYFDDLTILDSSSSPKRIDFFQIKGLSSGSWTIKQLVKEDKATLPPRSIIGRMYKNAKDFAAFTNSITFVSNGPFKVTLKDGTTSTENNVRIIGSDLSDSEITGIEIVLETDFPAPRNPTCAEILIFERTNLPLQEQAIFVTGRLVEHLEKCSSGESFTVKALYDVLYRNIFARTGSTEETNSLDGVWERKSLARNEIAALIARAVQKQQFETLWPLISDELRAAGYTAMNIIKIHTESIRHLKSKAKSEKGAMDFSIRVRDLVTCH
jgi:hypothetical protein